MDDDIVQRFETCTSKQTNSNSCGFHYIFYSRRILVKVVKILKKNGLLLLHGHFIFSLNNIIISQKLAEKFFVANYGQCVPIWEADAFSFVLSRKFQETFQHSWFSSFLQSNYLSLQQYNNTFITAYAPLCILSTSSIIHKICKLFKWKEKVRERRRKEDGMEREKVRNHDNKIIVVQTKSA